MTDWYEEILASAYLEIECDSPQGYRYKISDIESGKKLVVPTTVYDFNNIVLKRATDEWPDKIYDVKTKKLGPDLYKLVGKVWSTTTVMVFTGSVDDFGHEFLSVKNSNKAIQQMLKDRSNWSKSTHVPRQYT